VSLVQVHLKERMHALEEKNNLSTELHQTRKKLEELANQKVRIISVADPDPNPDPSDPYVFAPPGSGSFCHQAKILRKALIPTVL
jgi:hypothetical protein